MASAAAAAAALATICVLLCSFHSNPAPSAWPSFCEGRTEKDGGKRWRLGGERLLIVGKLGRNGQRHLRGGGRWASCNIKQLADTAGCMCLRLTLLLCVLPRPLRLFLALTPSLCSKTAVSLPSPPPPLSVLPSPPQRPRSSTPLRESPQKKM